MYWTLELWKCSLPQVRTPGPKRCSVKVEVSVSHLNTVPQLSHVTCQ